MPHLLYVVDPMCSWCFGFAPALKEARAQSSAQPLPESTEKASHATPARLPVELVMGGLAPDSDEPMPAEMRAYVQQAWHAVTARTGVEFEHRFWQECAPRRSTYPACRAVIAAGFLEQRARGSRKPATLPHAPAAESAATNPPNSQHATPRTPQFEASYPDFGPMLWLDAKPGEMLHAIQHAYYRDAQNPSDADTLIECAAAIGFDRQAFAAQLEAYETERALQAHLARRRALGADSFPTVGMVHQGKERVVIGGCVSAGELGKAVHEVLRTL